MPYLTETPLYYVVAPIERLHLTTDFCIDSAELYGCQPDYKPIATASWTYNHPYKYLSSITFDKYSSINQYCTMDDLSVECINHLTSQCLKDFTCIAFEVELDNFDFHLSNNADKDTKLLQYLIERGERIIDVLRLCFFYPGENKSIGKVGAISSGIYGLWIGSNDNVKFIARKISRYQLVQEPMKLTPIELGAIYYDFTFRSLSHAACFNFHIDPILERIFQGLRAFRESRELQVWEARFRQLGAIAEFLAKRDENEYLRGNKLRDRIAQIAERGWKLYTNYGMSALAPPMDINKESLRQIGKRQDMMGWLYKDDARNMVKDLWDNVRNPLAHTVNTIDTLNRNSEEDMMNMERVVITMINGIHTAYEVQDLCEASVYDILIG